MRNFDRTCLVKELRSLIQTASRSQTGHLCPDALTTTWTLAFGVIKHLAVEKGKIWWRVSKLLHHWSWQTELIRFSCTLRVACSLCLCEGLILHHLAAAWTFISTLNFFFNNVLSNVDILGLLSWTFLGTYSATRSKKSGLGRVGVAIHIQKFLAVLLHHGWVGWLHPCILGLNPFFTFTICERVWSELLRFVLRSLAASTTAHFLGVISESLTVALEVRISGLDSWSQSLRIIELVVTIKEFWRFFWVINYVVVDVVVVYYVGDITWLHCQIFFAYRLALVR